MTTIVIDSTDKPKASPEALLAYSREIVPMIKQLIYQKELLKDFLENDDTALDLKSAIDTAKEQLEEFLEKDDTAVAINEKITDISNDIKQALKGAARVCDFKPAELNAFFTARVKESVAKVVDKGTVFSTLEELLK